MEVVEKYILRILQILEYVAWLCWTWEHDTLLLGYMKAAVKRLWRKKHQINSVCIFRIPVLIMISADTRKMLGMRVTAKYDNRLEFATWLKWDKIETDG
jgi:hypothetical protein